MERRNCIDMHPTPKWALKKKGDEKLEIKGNHIDNCLLNCSKRPLRRDESHHTNHR